MPGDPLTVTSSTGPVESCSLDLQRERTLLSTVIDQIPDDVILLDHAGCVVEINAAAVARSGGKREDYVGRPGWRSLGNFNGMCASPEGPEGCGEEQALDQAIRRGERHEHVQTRVDEQGRMHYYRVYSYPVLDPDGSLRHTVVLRRDITQRTYMERRLQQSEKLAAVGELSTFIAHEIRNPLFAIAGFANSLLRTAGLDEKSREKVSIILEESNRLDTILKSILNFARPTQGKAGQVDVGEVGRQTMELMAIGCQTQGIEVKMDIAPGLPLAKGDPELLKQCIINMVKNSIEAMPGGGVLTLRCHVRGDRVVLEVEDTGRGIPAEYLGEVFNPFFSTKDKGSGLGLAMTKKILDEAGGGVELESEVGKGTRVRLILAPLTAADEGLEPRRLGDDLPRAAGAQQNGTDGNGRDT